MGTFRSKPTHRWDGTNGVSLTLYVRFVGKPPGHRVTQEGLELGDLGRLRGRGTDVVGPEGEEVALGQPRR